MSDRKGVKNLEIIMESDDIAMTARDSFQNGDLITNLPSDMSRSLCLIWKMIDHILSTLHQLFIDDLAGIVFPCLDVDCLLDNGICSRSKRLANAVLVR